jgi:uracil-DNA glycosylase family 4
MNKRLQLAVRKPLCEDCALGQRDLSPSDRCVTGFGPNSAQWMIITNYPVQEGSHLHRQIVSEFKEVGLDATSAMWCSAVKCRVWDLVPNAKELKTCKPYLLQEIDFVRPQFAITFGNEAMYAFTGKIRGINQKRGQVTEYNGTKIFHTISPMSTLKDLRKKPGYMADLRYFYKLVNDEARNDPYHKPTSDRQMTLTTVQDIKIFCNELERTEIVAFDIESTGLDEYRSDAAVISLCVTMAKTGMEDAFVWKLPLYHPESPFRRKWRNVLKLIGPYLAKVPKLVAHNGKHDCRWLRHFGVPHITHTFDTIMALSVLNENEEKGLKPAAQRILGAEPWGIDTKDLLNTPIDEVLNYCGLDTWHDLRLYFYLKSQLIQHPRQGRLFARLLMPAVQELIEIETTGVYVDTKKLKENGHEIRRRLFQAEKKLDEFLPPWKSDFPETFITRGGEVKVNWNPSDFCRWFLFEHLNLPILKRGKTKPDGSPGNPSMDRDTLMVLADKHEAVPILMNRAKWSQLQNTFITPYEELLGADSRLRTVFKPWGTVTGRMSSGGEDEEKLSGAALRGQSVNFQQVPNEPLVRSVIGSQPGWWWVTADQSQLELRLAAFYSQDSNMLQAYQTGQDLHALAAAHMTGKSVALVTKEERRRAKARNFGFLYGMGWKKFIVYAFTQYGIAYTEEEARANRAAFFDQFPGLRVWHAKQRRLVSKYERVETPMGRVRHLPGINSPDEAIKSEAERQAINSPVQAFGSDICMLAMVYIARDLRRQKLRARTVGFVHDSVNFEIHNDDLIPALHIIQSGMENPPLKELFRVELNVPLKVDLTTGVHWGEGKEIKNIDRVFEEIAA